MSSWATRVNEPGAEGVQRVPVVIVGGGPVGLSMSLLLSRLDVPNVVLEKRAGTSDLPRARGMNCRTVEIWRMLGLIEAMTEISLPEEWTRSILYVTRLAGDEIGRMDSASMWRQATAHYSPAPFLCSSQDRIDAVLRTEAESRPQARVLFGHEVVGVRSAADGVTVDMLDGDGPEYQVQADWVVAADGAGSFVRKQTGIQLQGQRSNRWYLNVHFTADLSPYTDRDRKGVLIWTLDSNHEGVFQPLDGRRDWGCGVNFDAEEVDPSEFDDERVIALVKDMIDDPAPEIDMELIGFRPWFVSATIAERYRSGRILLAGDAAHQIPPFGGQGMNTGIQDAHNLAWKLAAVIKGEADPVLLDSYENERQEIADRICAFGRRNVGHVTDIRSGQSDRHVQVAKEYGNWSNIDAGVHYNAGALVPDGSPLPETEESVITYVPHARPGWRLPHRWLRASSGDRVSTIDLFVDSFVMLAGPDGAAWDSVSALAGDGSGRFIALREGRDFDVEADSPLYDFLGVKADGALLVRPDGHVAARWFEAPSDPERAVREALAGIGMVRVGSTA